MNVQLPIEVLGAVINRKVPEDWPKKAVPVGTTPVSQFAKSLKKGKTGVFSQVASCAWIASGSSAVATSAVEARSASRKKSARSRVRSLHQGPIPLPPKSWQNHASQVHTGTQFSTLGRLHWADRDCNSARARANGDQQRI